jgi:hypothetical protein
MKAFGRPSLRKCLLLVLLTLVVRVVVGMSAELNVQAIIVGQNAAARAHYPDARLFQVFVHNLVPEPKSAEEKARLEVHSYFEIGKAELFLDVISKDSKEYQEIVRPFKGNDCFHGYPVSRSEACIPSIQPPTTQDEYLGLDWTLDPARLAAAFRKCGLDPSAQFDVTILSAKRVLTSWKWADVQQASTINDRLSKEHPKEIIISATESSASGQSMGPTCLFKGTDYESFGSLVIIKPSSKLPPSR